MQIILNFCYIGQHCGEVIGVDLLQNGLGQSPDQIHAIGHSLGGQLVGHFGRKFKEISGNGPIGRITCNIFYNYQLLDLKQVWILVFLSLFSSKFSFGSC